MAWPTWVETNTNRFLTLYQFLEVVKLKLNGIRNEKTFADLPRNVTDNHYLYYLNSVNPEASNPWIRPIRTGAKRLKDTVKGVRRIRDYFEDVSLKNLGAIFKWFWSWLKHRFRRTRKFVTYKANPQAKPGIIKVNADARILLASDWGTGTADVIEISNVMKSTNPPPDITIHLGDVYYTGEKEEYEQYFFPYWPKGTHPQHPVLLLNANHEMYSGGYGYFDYALKQVNQEASYFCVENDHWRIIGLDTGYHSVKADKGKVEKQSSKKVKLPKPVIKWLREVVFTNPSDTRGVILLSHHQWFCSFGTEYPTPALQLRPWIKKPALWFWGHEHVFAAYGFTEEVDGQRDRGIPVYARCIGHGGMPIQIDRVLEKLDKRKNQERRTRELIVWDKRIDRTVEGTILGYNGFVDLQFKGKKLVASYRDKRNVLLREVWEATPNGVQGKLLSCKLDPEPGRKIEELYGEGIEKQAA
jgi:hypothetical protein